MWFSADNLVLLLFQAGCVALVGAGLPAWARRFRGSAWSLVMPLSIAVVVGAISVFPLTADALTWIALIGVPIGAALALGWAARGARPGLALLAVPLLALAFAKPNAADIGWSLLDDPVGQLATTVLVAGSAIALGRLLAGAAPLSWLKAGVYAMAAIDAYLVFSGRLQGPNDVLVAAVPGNGLPQLQSAGFGDFSIGYGDFFAAAVVGGILAAEGRPQSAAAAATLVLALAWDQLFLIYDVLPETIPPALALLGVEVVSRARSTPRRGAREAAGVGALEHPPELPRPVAPSRGSGRTTPAP